jgi:hypothetical protein
MTPPTLLLLHHDNRIVSVESGGLSQSSRAAVIRR